MQIDIREVGDIRVIDLAGDLALGGGDVAYRNAVIELLDTHHTKILVNTARVRRIDSVGIGEIIASNRRVQEQGGSLQIVAGPALEKLRSLLRVPLPVVFDNEEEALSSF